MTDSAGDQSRQAILQALNQRGGGTHKRELCRLTGRGWGTIGYHVYVLARQGMIMTEVHGRQLWVFSAGLSRGDRDWLVATRTPERRRLLDFIRRQPPMTINALSSEMELSKKVIRTHLQHLQRYGAVKDTGDYPPKYVPVQQDVRQP
jgi:predicted transcriptional regulator